MRSKPFSPEDVVPLLKLPKESAKADRRPHADPIERLRAQLWYLGVKKCCNWSDYKLDIEFGQEERKGDITGVDRTRVFGVIRNKGTLPSSGTHKSRGFNLVQRVDKDPRFDGARAMIESPFWELLTMPATDITVVSMFVEKCLAKLDFTRLSLKEAWLWYSFTAEASAREEIDVKVANMIEEIPGDFDLIALHGGLYREACLRFRPDDAKIAGELFRKLLRVVLDEPWTGLVGRSIFDIAIQRVLFGRYGYVTGREDQLKSLDDRVYVVSKRDPCFVQFFGQRDKLIANFKEPWNWGDEPSYFKMFDLLFRQLGSEEI